MSASQKKVAHHEAMLSSFPKITKPQQTKIWSDFRLCTGDLGGLSGEELRVRLGSLHGISHGGFKEVQTMIEAMFDEQTPTFKLHALTEENRFTFLDLGRIVPQAKVELWDRLIKTLDQILHERGYRLSIRTWQEFSLGPGSVEDYSKTPYVPIGILEKKMNAGEALRAREMQVMTHALSRWYKVEGNQEEAVAVAYEPLKRNRTVRDARTINKTGLAEALRLYPLMKAFEACEIPGVKSADYPAPHKVRAIG